MRRFVFVRATCCALMTGALILWGAALLEAQQSPFLPDALFRHFNNEISGDIAFEHIRWMTHYHTPGGSKGFHAVAEYIAQKAREAGLEDVRILKQKTRSVSWTAKEGELWIIEPEPIKLADIRDVAISLADYSRNADVTAELIDIGAGISDKDYEGKDVKGKIVLTSSAPPRVMEEAVWKRGALGVVSYASTRGLPTDFPDQIAWLRVPSRPNQERQAPTFAFVLSQRRGWMVRDLLARAKSPVKVHAKVASEFEEPAWMEMVEGVIKGTSIHDQDIVLTGHAQEERFSANDDRSGCANVLEIARALNKMIREGKIPRPLRDLRFWWTTEISSEYQYFADFPDERKQILVNINQDMVGAKQSVGSRVQFLTRTPWSRPSFLSDVGESIAQLLVAGNTSFLAASQARALGQSGLGQVSTSELNIYTKPVLSYLGTKERYDLRVIPFHNNTDHQVFNDGIIGIPAITFTNWPDDYIHSTDDDLWQMDATQLKRNAVTAAAIAWAVANASEKDVLNFASEIFSSGVSRLGHELKVALQLLRSSDKENSTAALKAARNQIRQGLLQEIGVLESVLKLAPSASGQTTQLVREFIHALEAEQARLRDQLDAAYRAQFLADPPAKIAPTEKEKTLAQKIPVVKASVAEYNEKSGNVKRVERLHALMAYEVFNFIDGQRSVLEIFNAVSAEAHSAGTFYYGTVSLEQVEQLVNNYVEAGIVGYK